MGLGGVYLSLAYTPMWIENMVAGRGWVAIALVIFSMWRAKKKAVGLSISMGPNALGKPFSKEQKA